MKNSQKNIYVLSDLHGNYVDFLRMLEYINFNEEDILYILGDIFNKYGSGLRIYDYIKDKSNIILIKGNHEFFVEKALKNKMLFYFYPKKTKFLVNDLKTKDKKYKKELYNYLKNLKLYEKIDNYILIHNNLYIPNRFSKLSIEEILKKQTNINTLVFSNKKLHTNLKETIIKGHNPVQDLIDFNRSERVKIFKNKNYVYIDGNCGNTERYGHLLCLEIIKNEEYSI